MAFVAQWRKLPAAPAPNDDPAAIKGNVSLEMKELGARILAWHVADYPGSRVFGHDALAKLKFAEVTIRKVGMGEAPEPVREDLSAEALRGLPLEAQTVCEITVDEGRWATMFSSQTDDEPNTINRYAQCAWDSGRSLFCSHGRCVRIPVWIARIGASFITDLMQWDLLVTIDAIIGYWNQCCRCVRGPQYQLPLSGRKVRNIGFAIMYCKSNAYT